MRKRPHPFPWKRYALYPAGCAILLSLPLSWVHQASTPYDYECRSCGRRFSRRTLPGRIALGLLWAVIILILLAVILEMIDFPEGSKLP